MTTKIATKWEKESADYKQYAKMYGAEELATSTKLMAGGQEFAIELVIGLTADNIPAMEVHSCGRIEIVSNVLKGVKSGQFKLA